MRQDIWYDSRGAGKIHGCRWLPAGEPKAVLQIVHGIAEFVERYDDFANYLTGQGFLVVAEDHMGHGQSINGEGIQGYFHGGWFSAVQDTYHLLEMTKQEYPDVPYILFGHSMGSFLALAFVSAQFINYFNYMYDCIACTECVCGTEQRIHRSGRSLVIVK